MVQCFGKMNLDIPHLAQPNVVVHVRRLRHVQTLQLLLCSLDPRLHVPKLSVVTPILRSHMSVCPPDFERVRDAFGSYSKAEL